MRLWNHSDSISNSVVKRSTGEDTLGVAPCENSSMPGKYLTKHLSDTLERCFVVFGSSFLLISPI